MIEEETAPPGTLKVRNISKAFPNVQALADVSLDILPGEILAFMVEKGYPKVITNWGLNSRLHEYKTDIFFTADGIVFSFENDNILFDTYNVKRKEFSSDNLELQIKSDPENPKFTKNSLKNLTDILKLTMRLDEAEKIDKVIKKLFLIENI